jgi:pterin-4a-carbinolamine dehydratase
MSPPSNLSPRWAETDGRLKRDFDFGDFSEAFGFMTRVALLAELHGHHPRLVKYLQPGIDFVDDA